MSFKNDTDEFIKCCNNNDCNEACKYYDYYNSGISNNMFTVKNIPSCYCNYVLDKYYIVDKNNIEYIKKYDLLQMLVLCGYNDTGVLADRIQYYCNYLMSRDYLAIINK